MGFSPPFLLFQTEVCRTVTYKEDKHGATEAERKWGISQNVFSTTFSASLSLWLPDLKGPV